MTSNDGGSWPARYAIQVGGHLDPHWAASFGLAITHEPDGTTTFSGAVADQAELHGILARIRDLGVPLVAVAAARRDDAAATAR